MYSLFNGTRRIFVDAKAGCVPAQIAGVFLVSLMLIIGFAVCY